MILNDKVELKINPSNIKRFKDAKVGEIILISPFELSNGSHTKIDVKCDECGKEKTIKWNSYIKTYNNGDWLCRVCKTKESLNEKYGVDNVFQIESVKEKIKDTLIEKYNVDNISKLESIKEKKRETNLERYGVDHYIMSDSFKEKSIKTLNNKYNVDNISQVEDIKIQKKHKWDSKSKLDKEEILNKRHKTNMERYGYVCNLSDEVTLSRIKETNIDKYGYPNPSMSYIIKNKIIESNIETSNKKTFSNIENLNSIDVNTFNIKCDMCGSDYVIDKVLFYKRREKGNILCTECNIVSKNVSSKEIEIYNYVKSIYDGEIITSDRVILDGKELDMLIPDYNFAIEFNGNYWHSELYKHKNYHKEKFERCRDNGIYLFQVYEDDWEIRKNIVKSMIRNRLKLTENKVYARNCNVKVMSDNNLIRNFLEENHIQGYVGSTIKLGLYYKDILISLITFSKIDNNDYNLNRFCTKLNYNVIGGFSKLMNHFVCNYKFSKIITFSDNNYSDGSLYLKNNFKWVNDLRVDYSYNYNGIRKHKFNFRKKKLKQLFENFDNNLSEHEIMLSNRIYRIYDSGKVKWEFQSLI